MLSKRDLLVLSKEINDDPDLMEREIEILDSILYQVETLYELCLCCELIDVNRYKIIRKPFLLEKAIRQKAFKPFQFLFNKN
jgi:hypothetical protein